MFAPNADKGTAFDITQIKQVVKTEKALIQTAFLLQIWRERLLQPVKFILQMLDFLL